MMILNAVLSLSVVLLSSPVLQLLHGRTQVAGCHHVYPPLNAVFGDKRVKRVRQHAEG